MKKIFYIILISILFTPNSYSKNLSGFVIENENNKFNLQPISKFYKGKTPKITLKNGGNIKIIIFSHGTTRPQKKENCKKKYNAIPSSLLSLNHLLNFSLFNPLLIIYRNSEQIGLRAWISKIVQSKPISHTRLVGSRVDTYQLFIPCKQVTSSPPHCNGTQVGSLPERR